MSNPYPENSAEWLLHEIFAEPDPAIGCLRCGGGVVGVEGRYQCTCGWAAPTTQSGRDEFHPESTMNPEEPK